MWVHVAPYGVILTFQIRKASFDSFSAVSTNFAILQILRNTGRPPAYNGIETFSIRAKINVFRKSQNRRPLCRSPPSPEISPNPSRARKTLRARARVRKTKIHTKSPRSDLKIKPRILDHPTKWSPKAIFDTSRFRRLMIRTSLLRFTIRSRIKILPTSTGQKKAVSMNFWILFSRLARARRDLADIDDKNQKFKQILSKKCLSKLQNPKKSKFSF